MKSDLSSATTCSGEAASSTSTSTNPIPAVFNTASRPSILGRNLERSDASVAARIARTAGCTADANGPPAGTSPAVSALRRVASAGMELNSRKKLFGMLIGDPASSACFNIAARCRAQIDASWSACRSRTFGLISDMQRNYMRGNDARSPFSRGEEEASSAAGRSSLCLRCENRYRDRDDRSCLLHDVRAVGKIGNDLSCRARGHPHLDRRRIDLH